MNHAVFAYGTLRVGESNNSILDGHQGPATLSAKTAERYLMIVSRHSAAFPYLIPIDYWPAAASKAVHITGDILQTTDTGLRRCDKLEGHPDWYCRTKIKTIRGSGEASTEAWAYILTRAAFEEWDTDEYHIIESGDWKQFKGR